MVLGGTSLGSVTLGSDASASLPSDAPVAAALGTRAAPGQFVSGPFDPLGFLRARVWEYTIPAISGVSIAIGSASEASSDASLTERIATAIGSNSEDFSDATLVERIAATIASSSEGFTGATFAERLLLTIAAATEDFSDAVLAERLAAVIAASSEDYSAATLVNTAPGTTNLVIASASESSGAASMVVTNPVTTTGAGAFTFGGRRRALPKYLYHLGDIASSSESSSDARMGVRMPKKEPPRITLSVRSGGASRSAARLSERLAVVAASYGDTASEPTWTVTAWTLEDEDDERTLWLAYDLLEAGV